MTPTLRRAKQENNVVIAQLSGRQPLRLIPCAPPHGSPNHPTFPIARLSSSHDFAHPHDNLRRSTIARAENASKHDDYHIN
ncbi:MULTISPECIES: hypothetical protein [unclassified Bradyrhizobium]|uniref:hypothetical protein n=1 Tax=unclassified Bradyrhizobium TaxID=2631580 RepID=UPI000B845D51|nr:MULTISPECIES: hypothetical protein [unclassified Bradyrhizobium]MBB4381355.1 hypothetical protein [Bradyrhizobium sp. SBR1B]